MTAYKTLIVEKKGGVDWVTMNRPDALNAMNRALVDELQDYFGRLYTDHSVRVVVLRGASRAFCAGLDLQGTLEPLRRNRQWRSASRTRRAAPHQRNRDAHAPLPAADRLAGAWAGLRRRLRAGARFRHRTARRRA